VNYISNEASAEIFILMVGYLPAVFGLHFTWIGVNLSVRTASWFGNSPTGFSAVSCSLAVLFACPHYSLAEKILK